MTKKHWALVLSLVGAFTLGAITGVSCITASAQTTGRSAEGQLVTGIGGIFFKSDDPKAASDWYRDHLGIVGGVAGVNFLWREHDDPSREGFTVWSVFPRDTKYFGRESQNFMINYRVRDLDALMARLEEQGIKPVGNLEEFSYGRFAWIEDGDGNRIELWQPIDDEVD